MSHNFKGEELWEYNFTNHTPTEFAIQKIEAVRHYFKETAKTILVNSEPSREQSLALTNLETAAMYAIAAIVRYENKDLETSEE